MLSDFSFAQDTIGFIIEGDLDTKAMHELGARIHDTLIENKSMSLYLEEMDVHNISSNAVLIGTLFPFRYGKKFDKMALVSDRKWIHFIGFIQNSLFRMNVKSFSTEYRLDAMSWIMDR